MHSLYRYFSMDDVLLYIGASHNPFLREVQHSEHHDMTQVRYVEIEWFDTAQAALEAETIAIKRERPKWNVVHQRRKRWTRVTLPDHSTKEAVEAKGVKVEPVTRRGPPNKYPEPTPQQNAAIVTMWHSPMTLAGVTDKVRDMIGADVPKSWVRDRVKKLTGSAARDPDAPGKVPYDYEQ